jgi:SAM-dependent methyltransferase
VVAPAACALCGCRTHAVWAELPDRAQPIPGELFRLAQCRACGLVFLANPPADLGRYYSADYYAYAPHSNVSLSRSASMYARRLRYPEAFMPSIPPARRVLASLKYHLQSRRYEEDLHLPPYRVAGKLLDVGCGSGNYLNLVKALGWSTYGVEISPDAVEVAARAGHEVHTGDLTTAPFPTRSFDCILFWHSLEHVRDPLGVLRRARDLLRDDGCVVIGVPNIESTCARLFRHHWFNLDPPRHLFGFDSRTLRMLLDRAGLRVRTLRTFSRTHDWTYSYLYSRTALDRSVRLREPSSIQKLLLNPWCLMLSLAGRGDQLYAVAAKQPLKW